MKDRWLAGLAGQLRHPHGLAGRWIGSMLNRANRANVTAAVDALALAKGHVAADIGFGGGLSLGMLLERVGAAGEVHAVDLSRIMINRARRRHRQSVANGRLVLHEASMMDLPIIDSSVNAVMTVNTLYFVPDDAFIELARILAPTGRLVLGLGDPTAMARQPVAVHGFRIRPLADVERALGDTGLALVGRRRVGSGPDAFHILVAQAMAGSRTPEPPNSPAA
jgi:arsenite methyltransferase